MVALALGLIIWEVEKARALHRKRFPNTEVIHFAENSSINRGKNELLRKAIALKASYLALMSPRCRPPSNWITLAISHLGQEDVAVWRP